MKAAFILQVSSHARYWRRIEKLQEEGLEGKVFAFNREYYKGKKDESHYIALGNVERESYLKRIPSLVKALFQIKREVKDIDVIYTFGVDTFFMGWLGTMFRNKKAKLIYEVGDIRSVLTKDNVTGKLFRFIERRILKRTDLLVVTSEAFVEHYFKKIQGMKNINYHVIENKPELERNINQTEKVFRGPKDKITIGYFGVLRCRRSLEILKKLATEYGDRFNIYIRGISAGTEDLIEEMKDMENVEIAGEYTVPKDLYDMYGKIDVLWACYPYQGKKEGNWSWARTTRFYEACFFQTPMITQMHTQDAYFTLDKEIGITLDLGDIEESVKDLAGLSHERVERMKENYKNVSKETYTYSDEHHQLLNKLKR